MSFDPRLTPARADLAAKHLEGQVEAERFVEGTLCEVVDATAPVRREPRPDASQETQALKGERVAVYEITDEGWCWGQLEADGYVGWIPANAMSKPGDDANYKVTALSTLAFPAPNIKVPPIETLPFGTRLAVTRIEEPFAVTAYGGFIPARHLAPIDTFENDFVAVAERFLGTPYLWGGKTNNGIDCSGLVQVALQACGASCPRDSDMQERSLGASIAIEEARRGDLIFWNGHVAIVRDGASMLHANAFHMAVAIEPIGEAIARIEAAGSRVTSVKRP